MFSSGGDSSVVDPRSGKAGENRVTLREFLRVLFTPGCWMQMYSYSDAWERRLSWMLEHDRHFTLIDAHHATIDDVRLWIANHPYASFHPLSLPKCRARRITILKAHDRLMQDAQYSWRLAPDPHAELRSIQDDLKRDRERVRALIDAVVAYDDDVTRH